MNKTQVRTDLKPGETHYTLPEGCGKPFNVEMQIDGKWEHLAFVGLTVLETLGEDFKGYAIHADMIHVRPTPPAYVDRGLSMWIEVKE